MRSLTCFGMLVVTPLVGACAPSSDATDDRFIVTDSAGVWIAVSRSPRFSTPITIDSVPIITIPSDFDAPDHVLFEADAAVRLDGGRMVVANSGTSELFLFSDGGDFVGAFGRQGDGPGEFQRLFDLYGCGDDTLVVEELSRLSVLNGQTMEFDRSVQVIGHLSATRSNVAGMSVDCSAALMEDWHPPTAKVGEVFDASVTLYWAELATGRKDSIGTFLGSELLPWEIDGRPVPIRAPFGRNATWAVHSEGVVFGSGRDASYSVIGSDGQVLRIVRWDAAGNTLTDQDWEYFEASRAAFLTDHPREAALIPPLDALPRPETKPPYAAVMVDTVGRVWLQGYGRYGVTGPEPSSTWQVFSSTGEWVAEVRIPPGLEVLTIGDSTIVGAMRDELDLERIQVHALHLEQ